MSVDHMRNCLMFSISASEQIGVALAKPGPNLGTRQALLRSLQNTLIIAEECRQHFEEQLAAELKPKGHDDAE